MHGPGLMKILAGVSKGELTPEQAIEKLKDFHAEDIGVASVDHHRSLRQGFPEVIYCAGKTNDEVEAIAKAILEKSDVMLATRATEAMAGRIAAIAPEAVYHPRSGAVTVERQPRPRIGQTLVLSAGTSDIPVAEEAALTADIMGSRVEKIYDVGVAGIHRILHHAPKLGKARVVVVVAGMDGALPSVVGGLTRRPVIAVPTSVGYGASLGGLSALLAMLNSCASGVAVMNIDNGFGAGALAHKINSMPEDLEE